MTITHWLRESVIPRSIIRTPIYDNNKIEEFTNKGLYNSSTLSAESYWQNCPLLLVLFIKNRVDTELHIENSTFDLLEIHVSPFLFQEPNWP